MSRTPVPDLDVLVAEQLLDLGAVSARHSGMVDGKAIGQQVAQVRVFAGLCFCSQNFPGSRVLHTQFNSGAHTGTAARQPLSHCAIQCGDQPLASLKALSARQVGSSSSWANRKTGARMRRSDAA